MLSKLLQQAAGNAGAGAYVEDVFSTYLYTGNGSTQTITNGIDLAGEGGLVWIKNRDQADSHILTDTARGAGEILSSDATTAETTDADTTTAFNSDGFSIGTDVKVNTNTEDYASWTFRKAEKFFDIVTGTQTVAGNVTLNHNLGSIPGVIIVKNLSSANNWNVYHRSLGTSQYLTLETTDAASSAYAAWGGVAPTATQFTIGHQYPVGTPFVAYLFAHDAGGFGDDGTENVISCGSYTGSNTTPVSVTLGYEPQWLLIKRTDNAQSWTLYDNMRGLAVGSDDPFLIPNYSDAEVATNWISPTATGFQLTAIDQQVNVGGATYIYIAIRRGPMKTPENGTSVLGLNKYSATSDYQQITTGNLVDLGWQVLNGDGYKFFTRLIGAGYLNPASTAAENTSAATKFDYMDGFAPYYANSVGAFNPREVYGFRRAPGFFDVVCYTGTGVARTVNHNLGVVPEMMIVKGRNNALNWLVYHKNMPTPETAIIYLNRTFAKLTDSGTWNATNPTATVFSLGTAQTVNQNTVNFVAYLFATVPGVSKVGSYTGTGTTKQIDCGFSGGARFVMIKRTDSTGDWYVWDTARGIVAGNDPYLLLNSTAAEVTNTDYIDPYSAGFEISSTAPAAINASGGSFIYLAIA